MSDPSDSPVLDDATWNALVARHGKKIRVLDLNGRRWVLKGPTRAQWQMFKCDSTSMAPLAKVEASVQLARAVLAPYDPAGDVDSERKAFDALGEEYPGLLDVMGAHAEGLACGPLPVRELGPASSTPPVSGTPTSPQTA